MTTVHRAAIAVGFVPQPSESADPADGRFAPTTAIKQECFYLTEALLLTDQSKLTNYNPWQGQGNLIVMQP